MTRAGEDGSQTDPARFVERAIKAYVATSPQNRLPGGGGQRLFDEPIVGFASGEDPIFAEFKSAAVVGAFHLTPAEALPAYLSRQGRPSRPGRPGPLSVVAAAFPFTAGIRRSNDGESLMGSVKWNVAHHEGAVFAEGCLEAVARLLESHGYMSVVPSVTKPLYEIMTERGPVSDWSEKHIAFAAGLGTLGLSGGLITQVGKAVWCGSLITELALPATPRAYQDHLAHCLFYVNGSCRRCINRCPSGAVSENGWDAATCFRYNSEGLRGLIERSGLEGYPDDHVICGLCETMVPCEDRIPRRADL